jgi:hypothetical protein
MIASIDRNFLPFDVHFTAAGDQTRQKNRLASPDPTYVNTFAGSRRYRIDQEPSGIRSAFVPEKELYVDRSLSFVQTGPHYIRPVVIL